MNKRVAGRAGLVLAMVAILGIALSGAHSHVQGDRASSTCTVCAVADQPIAVAHVDPVPAPSPDGAADYPSSRLPDPFTSPASAIRPRAPPV